MPDGNSTVTTDTLTSAALTVPTASQPMPMAMAIWFDERIFEKAKTIAGYISNAKGFVPDHLIGHPQTCFALVELALTWKLSPFSVARSVYPLPGGKTGFEGKLVQAILTASGKIVGEIKYEFYGDWEKLKGKFEIKKNDKGKDYPVKTWTRADATGLGVKVIAQIKGEVDPRSLPFDLDEVTAFNSTMWATSPQRQIRYAAIRAFANGVVPELLMGVPFEGDEEFSYMVDVTPTRPKREDFEAGAKPATTTEVETESDAEEAISFDGVAADGEARTFDKAMDAAGFLLHQMQDAAAARGRDGAEGVWESNDTLVTQLREAGADKLADDLKAAYVQLTAKPAAAKTTAKESPAPSGNSAGAPTVAEGASGRETPPKEAAKTDTAAKSEPAGDLLGSRDEAFFARKSYAITPAKKGAALAWGGWDAMVRAADRDARTVVEHAKIIEDNAVHLEAYENSHPKEAKALYEFFKTTHARLTAAGGDAPAQAGQGTASSSWDD